MSRNDGPPSCRRVGWLACLPPAAALLLVGPLALAPADDPKAAEKDGVTRVRLLPPTPGKNPRNSEGTFLQLKDDLLFVYTQPITGQG